MAGRKNELVHFYDPEGPWAPLSNYSPHPITLDGIIYPTLEHYFQTRKFWIFDPDHAQYILDAPTPLDASKRGAARDKKLDPFWEQLKVKYMIQAVQLKISQNKNVLYSLIATQSSSLIYVSKRDNFWGVGRYGRGSNTMGVIYETAREDFKRKLLRGEL